MVPCWQAVWGVTFKIRVIFGVRFERLKSWQKQTYTKTEACKLYSRVLWIFLPNVIKIDRYNFDLYRFELGAFFSKTQCSGYLVRHISGLPARPPLRAHKEVRTIQKMASTVSILVPLFMLCHIVQCWIIHTNTHYSNKGQPETTDIKPKARNQPEA